MKKSLLFALAVTFTMGLASCEKCIECNYEFNGQTFTSGEICGSSDDVDAVRSTWEAAGTNAGVTTTCVED